MLNVCHVINGYPPTQSQKDGGMNMNEKETMEKINKTIDAELKKTPDDMTLKVEMIMEEEGLRLNFTRIKKEEK